MTNNKEIQKERKGIFLFVIQIIIIIIIILDGYNVKEK